MIRRSSVLAVLSLLLALLAPARSYAGPGEGEFTSRINGARRSNGRAPYAVRSDLASVARRHAVRMASAGRIYHNPSLGSEVGGWRSVGENVGVGSSVAEIHSAFMNSSGHRANILSRTFREVGVGTATGKDGRLYVAEVFRQPYGAVVRPAPRPTRRAAVQPRASRTRRRPPAATRPAAPRRPVPSTGQLLAARLRTALRTYAAHPPAGPLDGAVTYVLTMRTVAAIRLD